MKTFIREALISDLDGIADCAERFFAYAGYNEQGTPLNRSDFKEMVSAYIVGTNGVVLLLMDGLYVAGGIAGRVDEWGFNRSIKFGIELFYWIDENYRGFQSIKLLKLYEQKIKELGAQRNAMISVNTSLMESVNNLYKKMGYELYEQYFTKSF